ncbi:nucleic-acid-binding protein from mobile element jockey [Elysia marginata]|uniref:Nucleic-acid-binding protein from mobile element jockey n=1 Tax=Elysia marginata TaxID=1093978 RepID=A0AAV4H0Y2_9GAST|nr:nucleic-acid-binding protein from mobile element jockey [Elysia marginata]
MQSYTALTLKLNVRPYVPTPMRCFKCPKFGHGREKCRRQDPLCGECGKVSHAADNYKNGPHCVNCRGDHAASDKVCPKYAEEQVILRYRTYNGGTFQQARAAVVLEMAKELRPRTYAQVTKRKSTRAPVVSASAPGLTSKDIGVDNIDSVWSVPREFCSASRRAGGAPPSRPAPRQQSSPSQQSFPSQQSPFPSLPLGPQPRGIRTVEIWTPIRDPP